MDGNILNWRQILMPTKKSSPIYFAENWKLVDASWNG
jgi:hypothetical protein